MARAINHKSPCVHISYPTVDAFMSHPSVDMSSSVAWWKYPLRGLRDLARCNCWPDVVIDESLNQFSPSLNGKQITTFSVNGELVCYDWCDFVSDCAEQARDEWGAVAYHKIMCGPVSLSRGAVPAAQTVSKMAFLDQLPRLRELTENKTNDVAAMFRATDHGNRTEVVSIITDMENVESKAGVFPYRHRKTRPPKRLIVPLLPRDEHAKLLARSRVCVAMPGVGGDWTWRHSEILAIGSCLLMPEPTCSPPPGLVAGRSFATFKPDLSDFESVLRGLLDDDNRRDSIARNGARAWERGMSPVGLAASMVYPVLGKHFSEVCNG